MNGCYKDQLEGPGERREDTSQTWAPGALVLSLVFFLESEKPCGHIRTGGPLPISLLLSTNRRFTSNRPSSCVGLFLYSFPSPGVEIINVGTDDHRDALIRHQVSDFDFKISQLKSVVLMQRITE